MVRKVKASTRRRKSKKQKVQNELIDLLDEVEKLELQNQDLKYEVTKRGQTIKRRDEKIERLENEIEKLQARLNNDFETKSTRTEEQLLEIIEKAKSNNEKLSVVELAKRADISRQAIYKNYKYILNRL